MKLPVCERCGNSHIKEIVYGHPSIETSERAERGEIILGGCLVHPKKFTWHCQNYKHEWLDPTDPSAWWVGVVE